jgi:hypothetical protein
MCTLLAYRNPLTGIELAIAANRDELYRRPRGVFVVLQEHPLVIGGRDPEAGGTWLALTEAGLVVAVTNARLGARRGPEQRSRGLLALDLALTETMDQARDLLESEDLGRYAPVNVLLASSGGLMVASNLPEPRVESTEADALGIGNRPAFEADPRVSLLTEAGRAKPGEDASTYETRLQKLLARHEQPSACHHLLDGGTVASTLILLRQPFAESTIVHADGPPCKTAWSRIAFSTES